MGRHHLGRYPLRRRQRPPGIIGQPGHPHHPIPGQRRRARPRRRRTLVRAVGHHQLHRAPTGGIPSHSGQRRPRRQQQQHATRQQRQVARPALPSHRARRRPRQKAGRREGRHGGTVHRQQVQRRHRHGGQHRPGKDPGECKGGEPRRHHAADAPSTTRRTTWAGGASVRTSSQRAPTWRHAAPSATRKASKRARNAAHPAASRS